MATDLADWTQAVNVIGGSVSISGTATVTISGTPTVSISGTPNVNIANTPAVTINSGSVTATISGTPNINIQSQTVNLNTQQPQTKLTNLSFLTGTRTLTTDAVPSGTHALHFLVGGGAGDMTAVIVTGHTTAIQYWPFPVGTIGSGLISGTLTGGSSIFIPVDSSQDGQYDITATTTNNLTLRVTAVLDTQAPFVSNSPAAPIYNLPTGTRYTAFPSLARTTGTYTFDVPASGSSGLSVAGSNSGGGAGTATLHIQKQDVALLNNTGDLLVSTAAASGTAQYIRLAPGLPVTANQSANDSAGVTPRVQLVVATATLTTVVDIDLIP